MRILSFCILFFLSSSLAFAQGSPSFFQPINQFNTERNYPDSLIIARGFLDPISFLRSVIKEFDATKNQNIAVLVNGVYVATAQGNGIFNTALAEQELKQKVAMADIEQVEARYNPLYTPPNITYTYLGTINFVTNPMPNFKKAQEPPVEPWITAALLDVYKPQTRTKIGQDWANTKPRLGIFAGSQTKGGSVFAGASLEIPIYRRFSFQSDWMSNWKSQNATYRRLDNSTVYSFYNLWAIEANFVAKCYVSPRYPRVYAFAGPYVEYARNKWRAVILGSSPTASDYVHMQKPSFGSVFGLGVMFQSGFFFNFSGSIITMPKERLLYYQDLRGFTVTLGWSIEKR